MSWSSDYLTIVLLQSLHVLDLFLPKWASNAPNPSEYLPPRLSPTFTCKIVVLVLKTQTPYTPDIYCLAGEQCQGLSSLCTPAQQPWPSCTQMGVSAWLTTMGLLCPCNLKNLYAMQMMFTPPSTMNWSLEKEDPLSSWPFLKHSLLL